MGFISLKALARKVSSQLLKQKLAASVKIIDRVENIYEWENKIEEAKEYYLMIKTSDSKINQINNLLKISHPYKVYEFIFTNIDGGNENYLKWIQSTIDDTKNDI